MNNLPDIQMDYTTLDAFLDGRPEAKGMIDEHKRALLEAVNEDLPMFVGEYITDLIWEHGYDGTEDE